MSAAGYPWWLPAAACAAAAGLRGLGRTWRLDERNAPEYDAAVSTGERFVYCFWHARLLPLAYTHRGEGIAVLVSRHRDGELITRVIEALGFVTARGSSTRGGEAGLREMVAWGERGAQLAVTPDGPKGPPEELKDGVVYLAARLGRRVVPIGTSATPAWAARSWDRFRVPRPFARVAITHGAPIEVQPGATGDAFEAARRRVQQALHEVTAQVRERAGDIA